MSLSCIGEFNLWFITSIHPQGGGEAEQKRIQETIEKYEKLNEISDESVEEAAEVLETVQEAATEAGTEAADAAGRIFNAVVRFQSNAMLRLLDCSIVGFCLIKGKKESH